MYDYWNPVFSRNGQAPKHYRNQYQTDVITKKVLDVLDSTPSSHPFFLYVAPAAAHSTFKFPRVQSELPSRDPFLPYEALGLGWTYPEPSPRHKNLFPDAKVPRTPHFDPEIFEGKPSWHAHLRRKTPQEIEEMDKWYRLRLQTLQAVDESVEHIFLALERQGRLDNTYFVFLSDNGYHLGHLRLNVGKSTPYETDIRIPFIVRGPGVAKGAKSSKVITAADLAPTILKMAGVEPFDWMDGRPIAFRNNEEEKKREAFLVECEFARNEKICSTNVLADWDLAADEGFNGIYRNNQYKSVRLISESHNLYYAVWCTNETEFYDLKQDPWQLRNTVKDIDRRLQLRMEALVRVMKDCKGRGCHDPWSIIHPDGSVHSLDDAMSPEHDDLYKKIKPFRYKRCLRHMSPKNEDTRRVPDSGAHPPPVEVAKVNQQTGDVEWTQLSSSRAVKAPLEGPEIPLLKQTHGMPLDSHACSQPLLEKAKGTSFGFLDIPGYLVLRGWQATTMAAWNGLTGAFAWWNGWLVSEENLN